MYFNMVLSHCYTMYITLIQYILLWQWVLQTIYSYNTNLCNTLLCLFDHICISILYSLLDSLSLLPQPAAVEESCLKGTVPFLYIVEFSNSHFSNGKTPSTGYTVTNVHLMQQTVVEITVSPSLPFLGLTGPPLATTLNLGKRYYLLQLYIYIYQPLYA